MEAGLLLQAVAALFAANDWLEAFVCCEPKGCELVPAVCEDVLSEAKEW